MLNTHKLLYILPDVAFVAELLPGKKDHTFSVQAFRQINGEFINETSFLTENLEKLISKIDPEEYHVVLPDFLFTNTILTIDETVEAKVKAHLKETLLPDLQLSTDTHYLDTFILTQFQGKSKVQLSALEKSLVQPLAQVAANKGVQFTGVTSLSWAVKSVVSLEPSITIVQAGGSLYLAEQYIGVDQTNQATVDECEKLAETIKTLKGVESSLQTVYLLTNELVEEKLKAHISAILPVQQLASFKETENQMPSYIKQLIESSMRTLDIPDFKAPVFVLDTHAASSVATPAAAATTAKLAMADDDQPEKPADDETETDDDLADLDEVEDVTTFEATETEPTPEKTLESAVDQDGDDDEEDEPLPPPSTSTQASLAEAVASTAAPILLAETVMSTTTTATSLEEAEADLAELDTPEQQHKPEPKTEKPAIDPAHENVRAVSMDELDDRPMHHDADHSSPKHSSATTEVSSASAANPTVAATQPTPSPVVKKVIKNKSGVGDMVKTIGIMLVVFLITVGVGIGLGLGVLSMTQKSTEPDPTPTPVASTAPSVAPTTTPVPAATSSATPSAPTNQQSILVVNATTISGYAGKTKKQLETAGYKKVVASNAKDTYTKGTFVLMEKEDAALIAELEKATELELTFQADPSAEDPKGEYTAVIVLGE